jgi:hypothetical protein
MNPGVQSNGGPSPTTVYATLAPLPVAYLVRGIAR